MDQASIATTKATGHARSNSLPSKSHPLFVSVEDQLQKLRSSEPASSLPSILCKNLAALQDLFQCVNNFLQSPLAQKGFGNEQKDKFVEDVLDGSLRLLEMCGNIRDVYSHIKGCVQVLESSLRRRNCRESSLENEIEKYFISRKKVNKMVISKCYENLKQKGNLALLDKDQELTVALVGLLKEVEAVSFIVFKSLLSFVSQRSNSHRWSLVSKFIKSKGVACEDDEENDGNIVNLENIDDSLDDLMRHKSKAINEMQVHKTQKGLVAMELRLKEIEEGLDCVFRYLIKSRVSLLNIINH